MYKKEKNDNNKLRNLIKIIRNKRNKEEEKEMKINSKEIKQVFYNEARKRKKEITNKKEKGITLIALVVTIVVLLILAGVTITTVLGDDGIIAKAKEAADKTKEAEEQIQSELGRLPGEIESWVNGGSGGSGTEPTPETSTPTPEQSTGKPQIKDKLGKVIDQTKNTTVYDEFDNPVTIPAGFHIVTTEEDSTVEYDYSNSKMPTVQDGIVVADENKNQFVWIPVGEITNKDKSTTTITLGRYTEFTDEEIPETEGEAINTYYIEETKSEHESSGKGNTIAKNIDAFKESVNGKEGTAGNGGYYLARYEASYGGQNKPLSKPSEGKPEVFSDYKEHIPTEVGKLWNNILQSTAAEAARAMYTSSNYTSDLTNSYAWDTAIVFIQKYSGNATYSKQTSINKSGPLNTGEGSDRKDTIDKVCNIYDMASNCMEWTTETSTLSGYPCVFRGGSYNGSDDFTAFRGIGFTSSASSYLSFRPILYVALNTGE